MKISDYLCIHSHQIQTIMNANDFNPIVKTLPKEFTSHQFIKAYIRANEAEYISELKPKKGGFRELNSKIGRILEDNQDSLEIQKGNGKVKDENVKGYISDNAKWTRTDI